MFQWNSRRGNAENEPVSGDTLAQTQTPIQIMDQFSGPGRQ